VTHGLLVIGLIEGTGEYISNFSSLNTIEIILIFWVNVIYDILKPVFIDIHYKNIHYYFLFLFVSIGALL
jgi:hypothetical protein